MTQDLPTLAEAKKLAKALRKRLADEGVVLGHSQALERATTILSSQQLRPGWFRLVLNLDEAVDVVRFESFSNLRKQIRIEVGLAGHSKERTSDGRPHGELDP